MNAQPQLPKNILESDLKHPRQSGAVLKMSNKKYFAWRERPENKVVDEFELWYCTGMGWVIPTLLIRTTRRMDRTNRTYAIALTGQPCRVGFGPHVTKHVTVYVTEARRKPLQQFLDLKLRGEQTSHQIRDRISSRRAVTAMRRSSYSPFDSIGL